ncbi:MAG: hypothetical protein E6J06_05035 [Chloroflexi bacterium]|nr:MAG: hypothetical protein E6J06_05035 [Chloroflexota bacterium]
MPGMRMLGPFVALGLFGAACGSPPQSASGTAGEPPPQFESGTIGTDINVTGTIDRGPMPTCPTDEPCDPQMVAALLVFSRPGSPDIRVRVGGDGSFALHLDPGVYTIASAPPVFHGELEPSSVQVPKTGTMTLRLRVARSP